MPLYALATSDGSYSALKADWRAQCESFDEDFDGYAQGAFSVLDPLVAQPERRAGVFALRSAENTHEAVCQVNVAGLPGYQGLVMRVRFITLAPKYDFGDTDMDRYGELLLELFVGIFTLTQHGSLAAQHIKFHLSSPADRTFFAALATPLSQQGGSIFSSVEVRGSWLHVTIV